ncbi:MAG TPA: PIN domain-containing protein [Thermoanaerobaculia bacterium]
MIFVDTSAIYALASRSDVNHDNAKTKFTELIASKVPLLTHNYVLAEAMALLQHRLGLESAARFERESQWLEIEWITQETHTEAVRRWSLGTRSVSFIDHVSFLIMQLRSVTTAFTFNGDFRDAGFRLY